MKSYKTQILTPTRNQLHLKAWRGIDAISAHDAIARRFAIAGQTPGTLARIIRRHGPRLVGYVTEATTPTHDNGTPVFCQSFTVTLAEASR